MNIYYSDSSGNYTTNISDKSDKNAVASAIYNNSYEKVGWDFLAISTYEKKDNKYNDSIKAYAMGYLEGILTKDRIYSYYINILHYNEYSNYTLPNNLYTFLKNNLEYIKETSLSKKDSDPYWEEVYFIYQQFMGMYDGYNNNVENDKKLDVVNFFMIPSFGDTFDSINYNESNKLNFKTMSVSDIEEYTIIHSFCSALVKLSNNSDDIWFGHTSWNTYSTDIRIFKEYRFISNKGNEKSKTNIFSSYPGSLSSLDDFYYLDSNLTVMETTNVILNESLYKLLSPNTLPTFLRAVLANRLASSAEEWTEIFKKENSGTYNNQYIILDINKINFNNSILPNKTLMIIEQMPGYTETNDVTYLLRNGYFPSYNIPYSKKIRNETGYESMIELHPNLNISLDYDNAARAQIFRRDQSKINSNEDFKNILRYNNYKEDEISRGHPGYSISSRYDLSETDYICAGGYDSKFISIKEILEKKNVAHIILGSTNNQLPTFSWANTTCNSQNPDKFYHEGVVETFNFTWLDYKFQLLNDEENIINNTNITNNTNIINNTNITYNTDEIDDKNNNEAFQTFSINRKKKGLSGGAIAGIVLSCSFVVILAAIIFLMNKNKPTKNVLENTIGINTNVVRP